MARSGPGAGGLRFSFAPSSPGPSPLGALGPLVWALSLSSRTSSPPDRPRCATPLPQLSWERLRKPCLYGAPGDGTRSVGSGNPWDLADGAGAVAEGLGEGAILFHRPQVFPRWDYPRSGGTLPIFKGVNTSLLASFQAERSLSASLISPCCSRSGPELGFVPRGSCLCCLGPGSSLVRLLRGWQDLGDVFCGGLEPRAKPAG